MVSNKYITLLQKYAQRKSCLDPDKEKEVHAFNCLAKHHMSSDEDEINDTIYPVDIKAAQ
jgi:hypothetical protein